MTRNVIYTNRDVQSTTLTKIKPNFELSDTQSSSKCLSKTEKNTGGKQRNKDKSYPPSSHSKLDKHLTYFTE